MRHFYQIRHKAIYMPGTALLKFTIISARLYYLKTGTNRISGRLSLTQISLKMGALSP